MDLESRGDKPFVQPLPEIAALGFCRALFLGRTAGIDVETDRETAIDRLRSGHQQALATDGFHVERRVTAAQVHGRQVAVITAESIPTTPVPDVDSLTTATPGVCLSIYVADCAAVYFADPRRRAVALAHSGKKGTELNIVAATIQAMIDRFGTNPADLTVSVSPSIRPPYYEVDFAATIAAQARAYRVGSFHDCGQCTAADLGKYYSYRVEKGRTGRMLAAIEIIE